MDKTDRLKKHASGNENGVLVLKRLKDQRIGTKNNRNEGNNTSRMVEWMKEINSNSVMNINSDLFRSDSELPSLPELAIKKRNSPSPPKDRYTLTCTPTEEQNSPSPPNCLRNSSLFRSDSELLTLRQLTSPSPPKDRPGPTCSPIEEKNSQSPPRRFSLGPSRRFSIPSTFKIGIFNSANASNKEAKNEKNMEEIQIDECIDNESNVSFDDTCTIDNINNTISKPKVPNKDIRNKCFSILLPFIYYALGMLSCYLVLIMTHQKIGIPYQKNVVAMLESDYGVSQTLNCVSRKYCAGPSFAVLDGFSIKLVCDDTVSRVTLEDMDDCEEDDSNTTSKD